LPFKFRQLSVLASDVFLQPRVRKDFGTLKKISADITALNPYAKRTLYIAGSGGDFNDDIFRNLDLPDHPEGIPGLLSPWTHAHVDRRDPFPTGFITADLVLLPVPMQFHLNPKDQQLAEWVQTTVLDSNGLGKCYRLVERYELEGGVEARLYERIQALDYDALVASLAPIAAAYPAFPAMYTLPPKPAFAISFTNFGDGQYALASYSASTKRVELHPGKKEFSELSLVSTIDQSLSAKAYLAEPCPGGADVNFVLTINNIQIDSCRIEGTNSRTYPLTVKKGDRIDFRIYAGENQDFCDKLFVDFSPK
jgi:hypothetical protein